MSRLQKQRGGTVHGLIKCFIVPQRIFFIIKREPRYKAAQDNTAQLIHNVLQKNVQSRKKCNILYVFLKKLNVYQLFRCKGKAKDVKAVADGSDDNVVQILAVHQHNHHVECQYKHHSAEQPLDVAAEFIIVFPAEIQRGNKREHKQHHVCQRKAGNARGVHCQHRHNGHA